MPRELVGLKMPGLLGKSSGSLNLCVVEACQSGCKGRGALMQGNKTENNVLYLDILFVVQEIYVVCVRLCAVSKLGWWVLGLLRTASLLVCLWG